MKQTILSLLVLIAVIFTFSCNTAVEPSSKNSARTAAITTQKVILLYGNYSLVKNNTLIELVDGNNVLQLPVSSLLDGKALFGDNATNKFQGPLLFKNEGSTYKLISSFLKLSGAGYSANKLSPDGSAGIVIPRNPPGCGVGGCPGMPSRQMLTMEVNIAVPITTEATTR
ncbi:hypothetical protein VB796_22380 [Arcicella sp. LKC2W]|uniref:hypothetical protein n=1 Tax=Arcicella sp. LKC2W TaxID=2984198 RepID=UPI002B20EDFE|nr:hypothetical protein [Arcicella sp. LKC2W]MEA5461834.1 hypothetical protein [Arcicella sp. LKC2W]